MFADTDVAEEDYVVAGEHLARPGEGGEIIAAAAEGDLWVEQHAVQIDAGIAGECVAQEAVFPARLESTTSTLSFTTRTAM